MYNSEIHPKDIAIEAKEELDEDDKGPTILKSEVVKAINQSSAYDLISRHAVAVMQ